ncbi:MAG: hypothetical protein ACI9W2_005370, partial [Gammaproteobacteria bacterium]
MLALAWVSLSSTELSHQFLSERVAALRATQLILYFAQAKADEFPLLALHGLFYSLMFGLPVLSPFNEWPGLAPRIGLSNGPCVLYGTFFVSRQFLFTSVRPISVGDGLWAARL